jgi:hypothetical protein
LAEEVSAVYEKQALLKIVSETLHGNIRNKNIKNSPCHLMQIKAEAALNPIVEASI